MKDHLKKLAKEFNAIKDDRERFRYILNHRGIFKLLLDNDSTMVVFNEEALMPYFNEDEVQGLIEGLPLNSFNEWLGWSEGVFILLDVIGIPADGV